MDVDITLKNYRCFSDSKPARFTVRTGITAFVGVNNSGKSSLLKFFYEFRNLFSLLSSPGNVAQAMRGGYQPFSPSSNIRDLPEMFHNGNSRDLSIELRPRLGSANKVARAPDAERVVVTVPRGTNTWTVAVSPLGSDPLPADLTEPTFEDTVLMSSTNPKVDLREFFDVCKALSSTLYVGSFRNAINMGANESYFDIHVGQAFINLWREFKTGKVKRNIDAAIGVEEEISRIFGFGGFQISASSDNQTLQMIIDGKPYALDELGSGLAQFVIVLINAIVSRPSFILIDEPELGLHSSLQLEFLTTLSSYCDEGTLFATHSIGLARAGSDWMYSLVRGDEGGNEVQPYESTPRLSEFLGQLSFSSHSDLGFDKVLLVEGSTDIKTVQQLLRLYRREHRVVLMSLGGSDFINANREAELLEVKRITENVSALIDSELPCAEAPLAPGRQAFVETCADVKIDCHVLDRRAIENYFTQDAVQAVKGPKYEALGEWRLLRDAPLGWAKEENWRIARAMTPRDLHDTDLGDFLGSL